jgi:hypothetical protein
MFFFFCSSTGKKEREQIFMCVEGEKRKATFFSGKQTTSDLDKVSV